MPTMKRLKLEANGKAVAVNIDEANYVSFDGEDSGIAHRYLNRRSGEYEYIFLTLEIDALVKAISEKHRHQSHIIQVEKLETQVKSLKDSVKRLENMLAEVREENYELRNQGLFSKFWSYIRG